MTEQLFNILLTAIIGLFASIAYYKYVKRESREAVLEQEKKDALAALVDQKHDMLIEKFDDTKRSIVRKIDAHCTDQAKWQDAVDERFFSHGHVIRDDKAEDIIIRKAFK